MLDLLRRKVYRHTDTDRDRVFDFRQKIYSLTQVKPESQKLIGLIKGKLPAKVDFQRISSLGLPHSRVKFTMVGTPEEESFKYVEPSKYTVRLRAGASSQLTAFSMRKPSMSRKIDSQSVEGGSQQQKMSETYASSQSLSRNTPSP